MLKATCFAAVVAWLFVPGLAVALDTSKLPPGANHLRAQHYADGTGVEVGVLDTVFYGILPTNHLGSRLVGQYTFVGKTPSQAPDALTNPFDDHETLVADVIASDDAVYGSTAISASRSSI
jgi:hypothetical protein